MDFSNYYLPEPEAVDQAFLNPAKTWGATAPSPAPLSAIRLQKKPALAPSYGIFIGKP
jgi:hypothetical protein